MIESYLGQSSAFLLKVLVNSCEDNLSLEVVVVISEGGKYCPSLHVSGGYVCTRNRTVSSNCTCNIFRRTYYSHTQIQMSWPLAVGTVPLISVTLLIRSVSVFLDICFPAAWLHIQILLLIIPTCRWHAHTNCSACSTLCQREFAEYWSEQVIYEGFVELTKSWALTQQFYHLTSNTGNKHTNIFSYPIHLFQHSTSQSGSHVRLSSKLDNARTDWPEQTDRPKPLIAAQSWHSLDWPMWLTPAHHQATMLLTPLTMAWI